MARSAPQLKIRPVVSPAEILAAREVVDDIYIDDRIKDYVVDIVSATRDPKAYKLDFADCVSFEPHLARRSASRLPQRRGHFCMAVRTSRRRT